MTQKVILTRFQIFMLVASMFLCLIPEQSYTNQTSFYNLMAIKFDDKSSDSKPTMRLEKMKCVINYMKIMCEHQ